MLGELLKLRRDLPGSNPLNLTGTPVKGSGNHEMPAAVAAFFIGANNADTLKWR